MKTLAEFKRDAASGKIALELIERYGKSEFPDRLSGVRTICKHNTVGITLVTAGGLESELRYTSAKLMEYSGDSLTIYSPGYRDLTEQEKTILEDWNRIECEYCKENPWGNSYWKKKSYFANCACPWLAGFEPIKGKYYTNGKVRDDAVRGETILKYKVHTNVQ